MKQTRATRTKAGMLAIAATVAVGACTADRATPTNAPATSPANVRTFLSNAQNAAREYGKEHLGHFRDLNENALQKFGLRVPPRVRLHVGSNHTGYCIQATTVDLEASNTWSIATASSSIGDISAEDDCTA